MVPQTPAEDDDHSVLHWIQTNTPEQVQLLSGVSFFLGLVIFPVVLVVSLAGGESPVAALLLSAGTAIALFFVGLYASLCSYAVEAYFDWFDT